MTPCRSDGSRGWIRGATSTLINHLKSCPFQSEAVREKAAAPRSSVPPNLLPLQIPLPPDSSLSPSSQFTAAGPSNGPGTHEWFSVAPQNSFFRPQLSPLIPGTPLLGIYDSNTNSPIIGSDSGSASAPSLPNAPSSRRMSRQLSLPHLNPWDSTKQKRFEMRIARLTASAGLPLSWVDNIEFIDLISDFIPGAKPPSRKVLTNRLIPTVVNELRAEAKSAASGHEATLEADGWTGENKHHLIGVMITVKGKVRFMFKNIFILRFSVVCRSIQFVSMTPHVNEKQQKTCLTYLRGLSKMLSMIGER